MIITLGKLVFNNSLSKQYLQVATTARMCCSPISKQEISSVRAHVQPEAYQFVFFMPYRIPRRNYQTEDS